MAASRFFYNLALHLQAIVKSFQDASEQVCPRRGAALAVDVHCQPFASIAVGCTLTVLPSRGRQEDFVYS